MIDNDHNNIDYLINRLMDKKWLFVELCKHNNVSHIIEQIVNNSKNITNFDSLINYEITKNDGPCVIKNSVGCQNDIFLLFLCVLIFEFCEK